MKNPDLGTCTKSNRLIVSPSYQAGAFDSHAVDCPFVFRHGDEYRMTFVGWDSTGYRTGWARSTDVRSWEKMGLLIDRGPAGSHTEYNVALTSIMRENGLYGAGELRQVDGRFVGTYHSYPDPGYEAGPGSIGLCYSRDLLHWELTGPLLTADEGEPWERGGLYKSWIMEHDSRYYLFYNAKNVTTGAWYEQTGVAYSDDLVRWERYPGNPVLRNGPAGAFDERFASDPCVLRHEDRWYAFYFGLARDGHARDGIAVGDDLLSWRQTHEPILDVGSDGSIDARHAHKPSIVASGGSIYHFYCAVEGLPEERRELGEIRHDERRGIAYALWTPAGEMP